MKPKEYLLKYGHIESIGRGRLSREHITIIEEAVKNGTYIEGYSLTTPGKATNAVDKPTVERVKVNNEKVIAELAPILYPEDEYVAVEWRDGKRVKRSMRSACCNTGVSLIGCPCGNHSIVAHDGRGWVAISIERA